jgi:PAS domain S-box-containing protein
MTVRGYKKRENIVEKGARKDSLHDSIHLQRLKRNRAIKRSLIKKYLLGKADEIAKSSKIKFKKLPVTDEDKKSIDKIQRCSKDIIKTIANNLNNLDRGSKQSARLSSKLGKHTILLKLSLEEIGKYLSALKMQIWAGLKESGYLNDIPKEEVIKIIYIVDAFYNVIVTEINTIYYNHYLKKFQKEEKETILSKESLERKILQQEVVSDISIKALKGLDLQDLLDDCLLRVGEALNVKYGVAWELLDGEEKLILRSKQGVKDICINKTVLDLKEKTPSSLAFSHKKPLIINDFDKENSINLPSFLKKHRVKSSIGVIIYVENNPKGVISFYSSDKRRFNKDDVNFVQSVANIVALAYEGLEKEDELRKMAVIVESSKDAIYSLDLKGNLTSWNKGAEKLYGYKPKEIVGKSIDIIIPQETGETATYYIDLLKQIRVGWNFEAVRQKKDGVKIDVSITFSPIINSEGQLEEISVIARDITEIKELQRRKDEFISVASHELKTPITTIKGYNDILINQFQDKNDYHSLDYLTKMKTQVDRLIALINDLLDVSRIQAGKLVLQKEEADLNRLIEEIISETQYTAKHKIIFNKSKIKPIQIDKYRLSQVLINLLSNAIKFSPRADTIVVSTFVKDNSVIVTVQDFGIGIHKRNMEKIFEPFQQIRTTIRQSFSGLGLGLHISKGIIERHGGRIWAESQKGKGSIFKFSLPLEDKK